MIERDLSTIFLKKRGNGRMEGWKDGRMEGWKDGRMEGWKDGRMESPDRDFDGRCWPGDAMGVVRLPE